MPVQTATTTQLLSDRYVLGPVLGLGGMAEVREGWDTQTGRLVAIKRLRPELAHDEELVSRFETERRVVAPLRHPNLVESLDQGEFLGVPYLVMERLTGKTLRDRLDDGPLALDEARAMALQLLAALDAVHLAGVLHL
jgi:serine/threonine-protein kinase